jgi:drug/metabolite transporter (DMT)-like permease
MNSSYGELVAVLTTLSWTLCVFPFTEAARRLGPDATNHLRLFLAVLMLTCGAWFLTGVLVDDLFLLPSAGNWFWLGLSGIIGLALGDYFSFTMYAILGTRIGSIFTTMAPGASLLLGFLVLDETVNLTGIAGILITVTGIVWLTLNKKEKDSIPDLGHGRIEKGILFGVLAAVCQGVGLVLAKKGLSGDTPITAIHATWIRMFTATVAIFASSFATGRGVATLRTIRSNKDNGVMYALVGTVFGPVIGVSLSLYVITQLEVSVAQTIFSLVPVFVIPFAFLLYREKITWKSLFGVLIAMAGVMLLIWREDVQSYLF